MGRWVLCLLGGGEGVRAEMDCEAALGCWVGRASWRGSGGNCWSELGVHFRFAGLGRETGGPDGADGRCAASQQQAKLGWSNRRRRANEDGCCFGKETFTLRENPAAAFATGSSGTWLFGLAVDGRWTGGREGVRR